MFERIEIFDKRYSELSQRLYEPSVAADPEQYQKIMKELTAPLFPNAEAGEYIVYHSLGNPFAGEGEQGVSGLMSVCSN